MKKILFLANHFITLYSFRKELIKRLAEEGNEVYLSLPDSEENKYFTDLGCNGSWSITAHSQKQIQRLMLQITKIQHTLPALDSVVFLGKFPGQLHEAPCRGGC